MSDNHKRLIEDYLPIRELNEIAKREKKHPEHPVALVHYWPARRPITACRAAIYSALVSCPESAEERQSAAHFVAGLANFNVGPTSIAEASARIAYAHGGRIPKVLDLFAGGGAIPLEAARLGCESHAVEYNPVAHLIELCTLVFPQKFGATLANDVEAAGAKLIQRLRRRVGHLYPSVSLGESAALEKQLKMFGSHDVKMSGSSEPVAFIWARTVPCRNPQCRAPVPLVKQSWLRKKGMTVSAVPFIKQSDKTLHWKIEIGGPPKEEGEDQTEAGGAVCLLCPTAVPAAYVKECGQNGKLGESLAAIVLAGPKSKVYLAGTTEAGAIPFVDVEKIAADLRISMPNEELKGKLRDQLPSYGFNTFKDVFTNRQLGVLLELAALIRDSYNQLTNDGMDSERAGAITTYLAMAFGRLANSFTRFCR